MQYQTGSRVRKAADARRARVTSGERPARAQARLLRLQPEGGRLSRKALAKRYHAEWSVIFNEELQRSGPRESRSNDS